MKRRLKGSEKEKPCKKVSFSFFFKEKFLKLQGSKVRKALVTAFLVILAPKPIRSRGRLAQAS